MTQPHLWLISYSFYPFLIFSCHHSSCSILSILADKPLPLFQIPLPITPYVTFFPFLYSRLTCFITLLSQHNHIILALYCVICSLVKWQNTTQSWRKGLGFNLCVVPPQDRIVPNFGVTEVTEFTKVFRSRLEVRTEGCTMVDIRTDPIIHDCVRICIHEWMYLWNGKIIRRLWGTTGTITRKGT